MTELAALQRMARKAGIINVALAMPILPKVMLEHELRSFQRLVEDALNEVTAAPPNTDSAQPAEILHSALEVVMEEQIRGGYVHESCLQHGKSLSEDEWTRVMRWRGVPVD